VTERISALDVSVFHVPTEAPESDGTLTWTSTTAVVVHVGASGRTGLGWTYSSPAAATVVESHLRAVVDGRDPMDVPGAWAAMVRAIRNLGRPGVVSAAIAAVDVALWDLKAKILDLPLASLLGRVRDEAPVYGSGGFTSYTVDQLVSQLSGWVDDGIDRVKMKIGTDWGSCAEQDVRRAAAVRQAIGDGPELFVDANGGYSRKQSVRVARQLADLGVTWFEEPVSSDDLAGLCAIRELTSIDVAAGEYGSDLAYFEHMCDARAVDVLQADISRCAGVTEWLRVAAVAQAHGLEISGHCAQTLHLHPALAAPNLRHLEYFHDHARLERLLFDGVASPRGGALAPDLTRPGIGVELKRADAERFRVQVPPPGSPARSNG
jgi:L-alanine-DL-glutamate epimerase-like enolase superfamily enzyme